MNNKKTIRAWTLYDWANSSFPLVINSAIFPMFYEAKTKVEMVGGKFSDVVTVLGFQFKNTEFYSYVVSLSLLIVCVTAPILSGIADYKGNKKAFLSIFCILGATSCAGLFFFDQHHLAYSMIPFMLATIGYWGSLVFYNAYLPEIATEDRQDNVSARGFALGYLGSSILLIVNLILLKGPTSEFYNARHAFISVALWWIIFAQYTLRKLPGNSLENKKSKGNILTNGFKELRQVFRELKDQLNLKKFLWSYFFYNMAVQTVMYMAVLFAAKAIQWPDENLKQTALIISILLIQFLGIAGSFLFSWLSSKIGNVSVLKIAVGLWILICVMVVFFVYAPMHFYITAASVGLVMGGTQALSRSTYSKLLPETHDTASYFSFFDVSEKVGIVLGVFMFGFIEGVTGDIRQSIWSLIVCFVIGLVMLFSVKMKNNYKL
jgi:MFS transporter, UMF1 family